MKLPEAYSRRIGASLGDAEAYLSCLAEPPVKGIRVNTLKISASDFTKISPFPLEGKVPWAENGFYISEEKPGKSPYFDAGLFYVQEPSAMCAAPLLDVRPGENVLDLCAAPGGKGTQLGEAMRGEGLLVLNEKVPDRAQVLSSNIERMGIRNAVVTCCDPQTLSERFAGRFDKILVDAPCSGEGMFRKEPAALENWSERNVLMCADRQQKILHSAAKMLRAGGRMVYSTCTFSEEEDERCIENFLADHREFVLLREEKLWPHRVRGEGHYAALLEKTDEVEGGSRICSPPRKNNKNFADKRAVALYKDFASEFFVSAPQGEFLSFGRSLWLVPDALFPLDGLKVLRSGIQLGEAKEGRFEPSHALVMAAARDHLGKVCSFSKEEIGAYLRGGTLACAENISGWCAVAVDGFPVGLGKAVGGVLKNHLPKALRHF